MMIIQLGRKSQHYGKVQRKCSFFKSVNAANSTVCYKIFNPKSQEPNSEPRGVNPQYIGYHLAGSLKFPTLRPTT